MDPFNPTRPDGEPIPPPLTAAPEEENTAANRVGEVVGGTADGAGLIADVVEGVSGVVSGVADAVGGVVSGAAEVAGGAAEAVGGAAEGVGSAVGAAAEGCGSCSLALLVMLASVGAAVAAVLR